MDSVYFFDVFLVSNSNFQRNLLVHLFPGVRIIGLILCGASLKQIYGVPLGRNAVPRSVLTQRARCRYRNVGRLWRKPKRNDAKGYE